MRGQVDEQGRPGKRAIHQDRLGLYSRGAKLEGGGRASFIKKGVNMIGLWSRQTNRRREHQPTRETDDRSSAHRKVTGRGEEKSGCGKKRAEERLTKLIKKRHQTRTRAIQSKGHEEKRRKKHVGNRMTREVRPGVTYVHLKNGKGK